MGWFDSFQSSRDEFDGTHHASLTHEALGGAVAYEAVKAYEDHCAANGKPDSHAKAKEIFAGLAGVAIDRLAETKGLDAWDSYQRKRALDHGKSTNMFTFTVTALTCGVAPQPAQTQFNDTVIVDQY